MSKKCGLRRAGAYAIIRGVGVLVKEREVCAMVEVMIDSVRISLMSQHRVVVLKESDSPRFLPIWIGPFEADAITLELQNVAVQRPLTHDLLKDIIGRLGAEVVRIAITELRDETYFAQITLEVDGRRVEIDSRPSDAIALAVRSRVPVWVADDVMDQAAITPEPDLDSGETETAAGSAWPQRRPKHSATSWKGSIYRVCVSSVGTRVAHDEASPALWPGGVSVVCGVRTRRHMETLNKTVPANPEAEEAVLGSLLIDPDAVIKVASFLEPDDFYREKNGWIYQAILDLHERREPADFVTLVDELERRDQLQQIGGAAYITSLINSVPTAIHVEHYARIVERTATLRRLIGAAGQIAALAYEDADDVDEVVDRAEQLDLRRLRAPRPARPHPRPPDHGRGCRPH